MKLITLSLIALLLLASCSFQSKAQNQQAQEIERSLWVVNPVQRSCIHYPGGNIDELVSGLQHETGEVCQVSLAKVPGDEVRTILCGDINTGKAWIVTEHEKTCQDMLKVYEQYNHKVIPESVPEKKSTPQGEKKAKEVDAIYEV